MQTLIEYIVSHGFDAHAAPDEHKIEVVIPDSGGEMHIFRVEPTINDVRDVLGY
jgi:hypothetical protein